MRFNNAVWAVRNWCREASRRYYQTAEMICEDTGHLHCFTGVHFAREMEYKAGTLIDREFDSFAHFLEAARELVRGRISYAPIQEKDSAAQAQIAEAEKAYLAFLDSLTADAEAEPEPYYRVIVGEEKDRIAYAILEKWDYSTACWYPLQGKPDEGMLFLHAEILEPYMDRLLKLLGLPENHVYEYGESCFVGEHCAEVEDLYGYGGNEAAYLPKDLSWIIYFSHEGTVTFAGTIVPAVRELLIDEKDHWNRWN